MERKWWTLLAVCVATFMLLLDITIVNVALPSIQRDLNASLSSLQWVVDAYALTLASFLLVFGSLGDRLGRRRIFSIGFGVFTLASLLCGLVERPDRAERLPGAPGGRRGGDVRDLPGADRPGVRGQRARQRDRRSGGRPWEARWRSVRWSAGCSPTRFGWEWIFFVNVPIGIARDHPHRDAGSRTSPPPTRSRSTGPGLASFSLALFGLIFGLIRGNSEGWASAQILVSLIGAAVLMAAFVVIELRSENAMLDLSLFRVPAVRRRLDRRLGAVGEHVRDVPLPHALHPGRPRLLAARGRACASSRSRCSRSSSRRSADSS